MWACKACEHQVCYPESIVICFLLCHVCQGDICERLSRMSNVKEIKDSLCVRKFTWLAQYSLLHPTIGKCSMFDRNHRPQPRLFCSGYISHQTPEKSLDWITMFEAGMRSSSSLKSKVHVQLHFSVGFMVIFCWKWFYRHNMEVWPESTEELLTWHSIKNPSCFCYYEYGKWAAFFPNSP